MAESRFALLKDLPNAGSSEERRALLRRVTDSIGGSAQPASDAEFAELDKVLSSVADEYSTQVRTEFARLVAASVTRFCDSAERFAMDDIEVAAPVLRHSRTLSESTLLKVVTEKSQQHMLAVTQRPDVTPVLSHALVERGDDNVVSALLANERAQIADHTYDIVAQRAETSPALQAPLVRRSGVPVDVLHGLYQKVEVQLRREILEKFQNVPPDQLETAFQRSRARVAEHHRNVPGDMPQARKRLASLQAAGSLNPPVLATLLREGATSRTAFKLVFARLVDVDFEVVDRAVEAGDLDTLALLCRGARFDRGLFVTIAVGLDQTAKGLAGAEQFGALYESVPIEAAQRALRFWKVRAA